MKLTTEQLGHVLHRSRHEPRRGLKRMLKDLGGTGAADELDRVLAQAEASPAVVAEADRLDVQRASVAKVVANGVDERVAEMLAAIRLAMQANGLSQSDVASRCGFKQPLMSDYLTGSKEPGIGNLAKIASALGCVWQLSRPPK